MALELVKAPTARRRASRMSRRSLNTIVSPSGGVMKVRILGRVKTSLGFLLICKEVRR